MGGGSPSCLQQEGRVQAAAFGGWVGKKVGCPKQCGRQDGERGRTLGSLESDTSRQKKKGGEELSG